ncbi:TetR family transcriptional regulator [Antrihabitans stalactiti]|uniref:TetR family transcriptional regulator n=1 Tax=Antrihabitans stalactiti TaxID=2584121 RepID=UPI00146AB851
MESTVLSTPAERGARRRERTRQVVLAAAESLLADREAESFRIEDVAVHAGVSAASIYAHFGTKDALIAAVVDHLVEMTESRLEAAYAAPATPSERFQLIGVTFMKLLLAHPAIGKYVALSAVREPATEAEGRVGARMNRLREGFEHAIQAVIDVGEMKPIDARLLSHSLLATWTATASLQLRRDDLRLSPDEIEAALRQTIRLLVAGLQPTHQRTTP